jgi:hypothetical protein
VRCVEYLTVRLFAEIATEGESDWSQADTRLPSGVLCRAPGRSALARVSVGSFAQISAEGQSNRPQRQPGPLPLCLLTRLAAQSYPPCREATDRLATSGKGCGNSGVEGKRVSESRRAPDLRKTVVAVVIGTSYRYVPLLECRSGAAVIDPTEVAMARQCGSTAVGE